MTDPMRTPEPAFGGFVIVTCARTGVTMERIDGFEEAHNLFGAKSRAPETLGVYWYGYAFKLVDYYQAI